MSVELPPRPQKGQKIPHDYFPRMWDHQKSLELHGDLQTTTVKRDRSGTTVTAPLRSNGNTESRADVIIAQIDTDGNDGTYTATEQKNAAGTFSDRTSTTGMIFDSGTNGELYELNGLRGVPVGTYVVVHRVANTSGGPIWYFDGQQDAYGVDGAGAWVKITANTSSPYSWTQLDPDASTTTSPAVTGSSDLYEVNGYDGYLKDMVVWAVKDGTNYQFSHHHDSFWAEITGESAGSYSWTEKQSNASTSTTRTGSTNATEVNGRAGIPTGSIVRMFQGAGPLNYRFEFHGADDGTLDVLDAGTSTTANTDTWDRESQGSLRGVDHPFVARMAVDSASGAVYAFCREKTYDANGHLLTISAETRKQIMTLDPTAIDCTTELAPDDTSISGNLVADWNAESLGLSDGASVGSWTDDVGSITASQATAAKKPIYKTSVYNGKAAVRFDGSDDYLDAGKVAALELTTFTIVGIWKRLGGGAASSSDHVFNNYGYDGSNEYGWVYRAATGATALLNAYSGSGGTNSTISYNDADALHAIAATHETAGRELFQEGVSQASSATSLALGYDSTNKVMFGDRWVSGAPAGEYGNIDVCRLLVYSSILTDEQIEQIGCWAITEYGI